MTKELEKFNKNGQVKMSLNSLSTVENDPTILHAKLIVHDFEVSGNNQVITEDVAEENMQTLVGKRICCKYISREENGGEDALGSHEEVESIDRDGNEVITTDTMAVGFIENVYIDDFTDENGITKRVVFADAVIWNDDKYRDIVGLLNEWLNRGIPVSMSVEYLYFNFTKKDGVDYIQSPIIYTAHTLLNSEDRGDAIEILPAYDCATMLSLNEMQAWNKAVASLKINKNELEESKKEDEKRMENKFLKALNELSIGDLRNSIFSALRDLMTANEYENMWISDYGIFPETKSFIYETYAENKWVNYMVNYTVDENDVMTVDYENRTEVQGQYTYVPVSDYESSMNAVKDLEKANEKITELEKSLNAKEVEKSKNEKKNEEFVDLTNKLVALNSQVEAMKPIVDKYNKDVFEKALNQATEDYKVKFKGVNALDVFDEDSTQSLIKESLSSDKEKSMNAIFSLNKLIVDNVKPVVDEVKSDNIMDEIPRVSINSIQKLEDNADLITNGADDVYADKYGINY
jgi:hypothetical protein